MNGPNQSLSSWLRVLRPLYAWMLLVVVLFLFHTHEELTKSTRLNFTTSLNGRPAVSDAMATIDGRGFRSGQQISIGWHKLAVSHPKSDPQSVDLFKWYGITDLGDISLQRSQGELRVEASPSAPLVTIRGPEFNRTLTNVTLVNLRLPTDEYSVHAKSAHWERGQSIVVRPSSVGIAHFSPPLGGLLVTSSLTNISCELLVGPEKIAATYELPWKVSDLEEGNYRIIAHHKNNDLEERILVRAGLTNEIAIRFRYGAALLTTVPPGVTVLTPENQTLGTTPLLLGELEPSMLHLVLKHADYEPLPVVVPISEGKTNVIDTNLREASYSNLITLASQYLVSSNFDSALTEGRKALAFKPDDPAAAELVRESSAKENLRRAQVLADSGDFDEALKRLDSALEILPELTGTKELQGVYRQRQQEERTRIERVTKERMQERLDQGKKAFAIVTGRNQDSDLFEAGEILTAMTVEKVQTSLREAFGKTPFAVRRWDEISHMVVPETFAIEAVQEFQTAFGTSAGRRICLLVASQIKDGQTQILYKVLEFKAEAVNKFSIGNLINAPVSVNYVPISPASGAPLNAELQRRISDGLALVKRRIQDGVGQP